MQTAQIIPFKFEACEVRTLLIDGQPWFVAADVCRVLDVTNTSQALQALDEDERSMFNIGRQGQANIINESGMYTLILRCRDAVKKGSKPHAFRKWLTAEVLPAIRKHGRYEDSRNNLGTLIGETIGTNGFNMLGALVKGKVAQLPTATQRRATAKIWSQTHAAFGVRSAADIPADQLDAARNFIAAYALEGEWLGRAETGSSLSRNDALAVEALVNDAEWLVYLLHRCGVVDHLRAVESPLAGSMAGRVESTSISHKLVRSLFADQLEAAAAWADELCGRPALRLVKGALPT